MNIGLIILVTSLFVGAKDNNNDQPAEIKKPNSERVTTNEEVVKNKISINQSDEIPQNTSGTDKSVNKKISHKQWQQHLYDSYSIMNECIFSKPKFSELYDGFSKMVNSKLSLKDLNKLQKYYGAPVVKSPHLIKQNQFFTGLYLDQNYYYYENGIQNTRYSIIEKTELYNILNNTNLYFSITNDKAKTETVLFNIESNLTDYPTYIPRETSVVAACDQVPIANDQNRININLNCQTVESFANSENISKQASIFYQSKSISDLQMLFCDPSDMEKCINMNNTFGWVYTKKLFANGKYDGNMMWPLKPVD